MQLITVAEISRTAGYHPPISDDASPRDVELAHEAAFVAHNLVHYRTAVPCEDPEHPWDFYLREPVDAEQAWLEQPLGDMKKIALSRVLRLQEGADSDFRDYIWRNYAAVEILGMLAGTREIPASVARGGEDCFGKLI